MFCPARVRRSVGCMPLDSKYAPVLQVDPRNRFVAVSTTWGNRLQICGIQCGDDICNAKINVHPSASNRHRYLTTVRSYFTAFLRFIHAFDFSFLFCFSLRCFLILTIKFVSCGGCVSRLHSHMNCQRFTAISNSRGVPHFGHFGTSLMICRFFFFIFNITLRQSHS